MGFSCAWIDRAHRGLRGDLSRQADRAHTAERSDSGRSAAEDGGRRLFCFAMQSVRRDFREIVIPCDPPDAAENSCRPPLRARAA
jgi:hypothetical protein